MSEEFIPVASTDELADGKMMRIEVAGQRLLLARVDGEFFAADEMCTHEDASLYLGCLHGEWVKCPLHGSRFNLRTGQVMDEPADEDLKVYPVKVDGDTVLIKLS